MTVTILKQGSHRPTHTSVKSLRSQPACISWFTLPTAYNMGEY